MKTFIITLALALLSGSVFAINEKQYQKIEIGMTGPELLTLASGPTGVEKTVYDTAECRGRSSSTDIWYYRGEAGLRGKTVTVTLCKGVVVRVTTSNIK